MTPVIASTKRESPKIESAGVEIGEKILADFEDEVGDCAKEAVIGQKRTTRIRSPRGIRELLESGINIRKFLLSICPRSLSGHRISAMFLDF